MVMNPPPKMKKSKLASNKKISNTHRTKYTSLLACSHRNRVDIYIIRKRINISNQYRYPYNKLYGCR